MFKYLSQLLILCCLLGQVVNVFGLPLAVTSNQDSMVSLQFKGCCTSNAIISCCGNDCKCCFSNELPSDYFALVQETAVGQGIQVLWLNPVSTNKCKGTNLISQFGVDMAIEEMAALELVLTSDSNQPTDSSSLSCGIKFSNFKPPRI
jgi:hypothetical protein